MSTITLTEFKNAFGSYIERMRRGEQFQLTKDGENIGVISLSSTSKIDILNSFVGIAKDIDPDDARMERILKK